ncbi:NHLP bacteriocin system secretion protein [uncultured Phenylobacterium sp.]|uniref:NHLP bacteriocin system secretion protein n=1 Tax=uncultured Phenylobacterium sp. TaxID=349273 RepID=UPI0025DB3129|nr:NHLP bacteriocin system secretion protein [uncultured Phenylobacterium sp.]
MTESIYRKAALDRLGSPERLDAPLTLVGRPAWLLLAAFAAALVGALGWAFATQAPVRVAASGILIDRTGLAEIVAGDDGRIEQLMVGPGDRVSAGQPIATIARPELRREIAEARSKLADAQARYDRLQGFYGAQGSRQQGADTVRLATLAQSRRALTERAAYLEQKARQMASLVERGFLQRDKLVDVQIELAEVRERIANLEESALRVGIDATTRSGERSLALLDQQRTIQEQTRAVELLSARLADQQVVRSPHAGRITELKVNAGDVVAVGAALATVAPDDDGRSLVALLYVPTSDGKRIEPGMSAEIVPSTVEREVYGHIPGRVLSVAPLPATPEGMRKVLQNDQLVAELTAAGAPIEVRVALSRDRSNMSGFSWSASRGPKSRVSAGSTIQGKVVVDRKPVIAWLIPRAGG